MSERYEAAAASSPAVALVLAWAPPGLTADELDEFHERAAILEYERGLPREEAEWIAWLRVMRK